MISIFDTVVEELRRDPTRTFTISQVSFFSRWWQSQNEVTRSLVRGLVENNQIEFVGGGWTMNDEANVMFDQVLEQLTLGHAFLWREFRVRPRIGWQIDSYGHANMQASLFSMLGYDGLFLHRIDAQDKAARQLTASLEFLWQGSSSLGLDSSIWTHILYDDYCYAPGMAFEWGQPAVVEADAPNSNIEQICDDFAVYARTMSAQFLHSNVLVPFGCDFQFQNAHINYKNMDKIIDYINDNKERYNMEIKYSTPWQYLKAVHNDQVRWEINHYDFFPYADAPFSTWSGLFSSRLAYREFIQSRGNLMLAAGAALASASATLSMQEVTVQSEKIGQLATEFALSLNNNGVSGTAREHVVQDSRRRLFEASTVAEGGLQEMLSELLSGTNWDVTELSSCPLANISVCPATTALLGDVALPVVFYNRLGWQRTARVTIPVPYNRVLVYDSNGQAVTAQVHSSLDDPNTWLVAFSVQIPALGYATYFIASGASALTHVAAAVNATKRVSVGRPDGKLNSDKSKTDDAETRKLAWAQVAHAQQLKQSSSSGSSTNNWVLENTHYKVLFGSSNMVENVVLKKQDGRTIPFKQSLLWFNSSSGNSAVSAQASGAFIFRPNSSTPFSFPGSPVLSVVKGSVVHEVRQMWPNKALSQVVRLWANAPFIEIETTIAPEVFADGNSREFVARFEGDMVSNSQFSTDSMRGEMQLRTLNARPTFAYTAAEKVASNFYPMNSAAFVEDFYKRLRVTVVSDRSLGVSSPGEGDLDLVLHRRVLSDDNRGLGQPLNDTSVNRIKNAIILATSAESPLTQRTLAVDRAAPPVMFFGAPTSSVKDWLARRTAAQSALRADLPPNIELVSLSIVTLDPVTGLPLDASAGVELPRQFLVRLHHMYAKDEHQVMSRPASVDLTTLFARYTVTDVIETSLSGLQIYANVTRLQWRTFGPSTEVKPYPAQSVPTTGQDYIATLNPMETRAFILTVKPIVK